jgi:hypothetical protein
VGSVWLAILVSPAALAECVEPLVGIGGSHLDSSVSNADRRELEQLLGMPVDEVACGRMQPTRRVARGFVVHRGFFVLTADEALFVGDRKVKEILFRAELTAVRQLNVVAFGGTQSLSIGSGGDAFDFELACDLVGRTLVDELERRTPVKMQRPMAGHPQGSCD